MASPKTSHDDALREQWSCEHCRTVYEGVDPPNDCDVCGSVLFENALDLAANGVLPVATRGKLLNADAGSQPN